MGSALLVISLALASAATDDVRWVVASVANVRGAPRADAPVVGKLGIGARVVASRCTNAFCHVRSVKSGVEGYVAVSLLGGAAPSQPVLVDDAVRSLERACALSPDDVRCLAALEAAYQLDGNDAAAARVAVVMKRKQERPPSSAGGPKVHDVGFHHGGENEVKDGERWFALCDGSFREVPVEVQVVVDGLLDVEGERTGREVIPPCGGSVLLKGIPGFSPASVRPAKQLEDGSFALGAQRMSLTHDNADVVLVNGKSDERRRVGVVDGDGGMTPQVLFAGDLDGDAKLDFIASYSDHYNVSALHLFLSSASDDWAPREVHEHRDTGC